MKAQLCKELLIMFLFAYTVLLGATSRGTGGGMLSGEGLEKTYPASSMIINFKMCLCSWYFSLSGIR